MTHSPSTGTDNTAPAADLAAFCAHLEGCRAAVVAATAGSPAFSPLGEGRRQALAEQIIGALLAGIGNPSVATAWCTELHHEPLAAEVDTQSMHLILDAARRQVLESALDALDAGIPAARAGVHQLLDYVDRAHAAITFFSQRDREAQIRRVNARMEQSLATTPLATIEWNKDGTILSWNPAASRIFGWSAEEALGQNIVQLLAPNSVLGQVEAIVRQLLSGAGGTSSRNLNLRKDGQLITCQWYNALLYDEQGMVIGALSQTEDVTAESRAEETLRENHEHLLLLQQATLRELSTPLIPLDEGVVAMPLIGSIDSTRAQQVIETLLEGVTVNHARVAILDITGVSVVDTQVANALIRAAQAVKLLGARVVLTGIRPEVAQTLVGLGVDLAGIVTRSSLRAGIAYAMGR